MKNYKVKATRDFKDLLEEVQRKTGDVWNCTKERYEFLKDHNAVELIEEPEVFVGYTQVIEEPVVEEVTIKEVKNKKSKKKGK